MGPEKRDFRQAILAGFVATLILTGLMYLAPVVGLPRIDMASALGTPINGIPATPLTSHWWVGLAIFFLFGSIVSPFVFVYTFPGLFGQPWLRGAEWGIVVWVFGGVAVMTMMGAGFDDVHFTHPFSTVALSLAAHLIYGAVLGFVAGFALKHLTRANVERPA